MKKAKRNKHLYLMTYIITALIIAAMLIFCFYMIRGINRQMNESAASNLLNTAQVIESNLENYITKDFESLNVVGELYKKGISTQDEAFDTLRKAMGFEWIGVCGEPEKNMSGKAWYDQWQKEERGYSDAYYGDSGRLQTTLWFPVYDNGELVCTVFGDVLLTKYYSAMQRME